MTTTLNAWKLFLDGRISQEKGDYTTAISAFDRACEAEPNNPSFSNAYAAAVNMANTAYGPSVTEIESAYRKLAETLVGENDSAASWIPELESLRRKALEAENRDVTAASAASVVW